MSAVRILVDFIEVPCDNDDELLENAVEVNLPHHDLILKLACESWNSSHMEQFFTGCLEGNIGSAIMRPKKDYNGRTAASIDVTGKPNFRFSLNRRIEVCNQVSAQLCDGWGEGFFHQKFTDEDGNVFTVI